MERSTKFKILLTGSLLMVTFLVSNCSSPVTAETTSTASQSLASMDLSAFPVEEVTEAEASGLIFMREEEKLARDVYITLYQSWGQRAFINISGSEQQHTDAIQLLLDRYQLSDPVTSDSVGSFTNSVLGDLYVQLVNQGSVSMIEALKVGALIEEIDILDLQRELDESVDNLDIAFVYENLMKGSRNHLRSFVRNLSAQGVTYTPQKLSMEVYSSIINSSMERGQQ